MAIALIFPDCSGGNERKIWFGLDHVSSWCKYVKTDARTLDWPGSGL